MSLAHLAPLGFPRCAHCPFVYNGTARICADCAARTIPPLAAHHCPVCSQALSAPGETCGNIICRWPLETRGFTRVDAIAMYSGALEQVIKLFKYEAAHRCWAAIFGRLVVGWLDAHAPEVADIDLILGNPSDPGRQPHQHIEAIMAAAYAEDALGRWSIPPPARPVLIKTRPTASSAGAHPRWSEKFSAAQEHARALELRGDVRGRHVLLVDDVFTTGAQFNTVAELLIKNGGAAEVRGLVLARAPWART